MTRGITAMLLAGLLASGCAVELSNERTGDDESELASSDDVGVDEGAVADDGVAQADDTHFEDGQFDDAEFDEAEFDDARFDDSRFDDGEFFDVPAAVEFVGDGEPQLVDGEKGTTAEDEIVLLMLAEPPPDPWRPDGDK